MEVLTAYEVPHSRYRMKFLIHQGRQICTLFSGCCKNIFFCFIYAWLGKPDVLNDPSLIFTHISKAFKTICLKLSELVQGSAYTCILSTYILLTQSLSNNKYLLTLKCPLPFKRETVV